MNGQARALLERPVVIPARETPWVAVTGGKGGVGKTVVAVNLALQLVKLGHKTLLVDFDPGLGNVDVHLRLSAPYDLEHAAAGECEPWRAVVDGPGRLKVVLGRSGSTRLCDGDAGFLQAALQTVATLGRGHDVVVCDTGAGIGPAVLEVVQRARLALAVTTPDPAAITDTYALCKVLHQRGTALPHLVVNRAERQDAEGIGRKLSAVCERFLSKPLPYLGKVRNTAEVERGVLEQRPLTLWSDGEGQSDLRELAASTASLLTNTTPRAPTVRPVNLVRPS